MIPPPVQHVLPNLPRVPVSHNDSGMVDLARDQLDGRLSSVLSRLERLPIEAVGLLAAAASHHDGALHFELLEAKDCCLSFPPRLKGLLSKVEAHTDAHHAFRARWKPVPEQADGELNFLLRELQARVPTVEHVLVPSNWLAAYKNLETTLLLLVDLDVLFFEQHGHHVPAAPTPWLPLDVHVYKLVKQPRIEADLALGDVLTRLNRAGDVFREMLDFWKVFYLTLLREAAAHASITHAKEVHDETGAALQQAWAAFKRDGRVAHLLQAATEFYIADDFHQALIQLDTKLVHFGTLHTGCLHVDLDVEHPADTVRQYHQPALKALEDAEVTIKNLTAGFAFAERQGPSPRHAAWKDARQQLSAVQVALSGTLKHVLQGFVQGYLPDPVSATSSLSSSAHSSLSSTSSHAHSHTSSLDAHWGHRPVGAHPHQ